MILKTKLQNRTFLNISIRMIFTSILFCSLVFSLIPFKAFASSFIQPYTEGITPDIQKVLDYANENYPQWDGSGRRYAVTYNPEGCSGGTEQMCLTNHSTVQLFSIKEDPVSAVPWNGVTISDSLSINTFWGTTDYLVYNNSNSAFTGDNKTIQIMTTGNTLSDNTPYLPINDVSYLIASNQSLNYLVYQSNIINNSTINAYADIPYPNVAFYPMKPVIHYLIYDRTFMIDCFGSKFFNDNPLNSSIKPASCDVFIDTSSSDSSNTQLSFYTGDNDISTQSNILNPDVFSNSHIFHGVGQTEFNSVLTNNGIVAFTLPSTYDYGTFYIKVAITTDNGSNSKTSVSVAEVKLDGTVFSGNSTDGVYVPPIYNECPAFSFSNLDWLNCAVGNVGKWVFQSIKSLFVPDLTTITSSLNTSRDDIIEKSGFLGQSYYAILDFFNSAITSANIPTCSLNFGTIFNGSATVSFDICSFEDNSPAVFAWFQSILVVTTLIGFLFASYRALLRLFRSNE